MRAKLLETLGQAILAGLVQGSPRLKNLPSGNLFDPQLQKGTIVDLEQPLRHMDTAIGINADQVAVEGGMMDLG